jgi:hypothetical protein
MSTADNKKEHKSKKRATADASAHEDASSTKRARTEPTASLLDKLDAPSNGVDTMNVDDAAHAAPAATNSTSAKTPASDAPSDAASSLPPASTVVSDKKTQEDLIAARDKKTQEDLMRKHGDAKNYTNTLTPNKVSKFSLKDIEVKHGKKAVLLNEGQRPLTVVGPPMPAHGVRVSGIGTKSSLTKDPFDFSRNRFILSTRTLYATDKTDASYAPTEVDRYMMTLDPDLLPRQETFYELINGSLLDRLCQLYCFKYKTANEWNSDIEVMKDDPRFDDVAWNDEAYMSRLWQTCAKNSLDELAAATDRHSQVAHAVLRTLIKIVRKNVQYWVNHGTNEQSKKFGIVADDVAGVHLIRFGTKVFWPVKGSPEGAVNMVTPLLQRRLENLKNRQTSTTTTTTNGKDKSATDAPSAPAVAADSAMVTIPSVDSLVGATTNGSDEKTGFDYADIDHKPMQSANYGSNFTRAEINTVIHTYTGEKNAYFRYANMRYYNAAGHQIVRTNAASADPYIFRGDYVAPEFGVAITKVDNNVYFHLDLRGIYVIAHTPRPTTVTDADVVHITPEMFGGEF